MIEIWKKCDQYPWIQVSSSGLVRNAESGKLLTQRVSMYGYKQVHIVKRPLGINVQRKVHRLVALAFLPNPDKYTDVNHIDENKFNNDVSNLEWVSHLENVNHGTRNSRIKQKLITLYHGL